jgi:thiamine transporter
MSKTRIPTKILAEASVIIALSFVLKDILPPIYQLPQGGSITIAGLVPLLWFALRRGVYYGAFAGAVYGLIHMAFGGYVINPIQGALDYPIAFAALGLAGFFKKFRLAGVGVGIFGRFICSFLSGVFFFTSLTVEGAVASAIYNGTYLIGEFIISVIVIYLLLLRKLLDIYA